MSAVQSARSYALPYPFPPGRVWAAIRDGVVMNMVYMAPIPEGMEFEAFRQQSRRELAREGVVWSGEVSGGRFVPKFESRDVRHTGELNTAREVRRR